MSDWVQQYVDDINGNLQKVIGAAQQQGVNVKVDTKTVVKVILYVDNHPTTVTELTEHYTKMVPPKTAAKKYTTKLLGHPKLRSRYDLKQRTHYQKQRAGQAHIPHYFNNDLFQLVHLDKYSTPLERVAHPVLAKRLDKIKKENDEQGRPTELPVPIAVGGPATGIYVAQWVPPTHAPDAEEFADPGI